MAFDLGDYVAVNDRVIEFVKKYPDGAIATGAPVGVPGRADLMMVQAIVYRTPNDPVPVTAWATEFLEGKTPYTRGREVENASTSAVGRALGYLGIGIKAGLASADEVQEQKARESAPQTAKKASSSPAKAAPAPDIDPWAVESLPLPPEPEPEGDMGEVMAALEGGIPNCQHGPRRWKEGTATSGKRWQGWMCPIGRKADSCEPLWR